MNKIRSVLVDDNELMLTMLSDLLEENHPGIEIIGMALNGQQGVDRIKTIATGLGFP